MELKELNNEQRHTLKQHILVETNKSVSYGELANADNLVSDNELEERFGGTEFVEEDFGLDFS
jgi:hypothetical protein